MRASVVLFLAIFTSFVGFSQSFTIEGNVYEKDPMAASAYESGMLTHVYGVATEYFYYCDGGGVFKAYRAIVGNIYGFVDANPQSRSVGYKLNGNPIFLTGYINVGTCPSGVNINSILNKYHVVENRPYYMRNVMDCVIELNEVGCVSYPEYSTAADAYVPEPGSGPTPPPVPQPVTTFNFYYDASGNMVERRIVVTMPNSSGISGDNRYAAAAYSDDIYEEEQPAAIVQNDINDEVPAPVESAIVPEVRYDQVGDFSFKIYPNPTMGELIIETNSVDVLPQTSVMLYDMNGRLIYTTNVVNAATVINLGSHRNGTYLLRLYNGENAVEWKIVKN